MGILNAIVRRTTRTISVKATSGKGANIDKSGVFSLPADSHTPQKPSEWEVYQSRGDTRKPKTFTKEQAMELEKQVEIQQQLAASSKEAYAALEKIKQADTEVNQAHYKYASVALAENAKVQGAKASHADKAIQAGVALEGMKIGLDSQERIANKEIELLEREFKAVW